MTYTLFCFLFFANILQDSITELRVGRVDIQRVEPTVKSIYLVFSLICYVLCLFLCLLCSRNM